MVDGGAGLGLVGWLGRLVGWLRVVGCFRILSLALVSDLGLESVVVVSDVVDGLNPTVWESHGIGSLHLLPVGVLVVAKVCAGVGILHSIVEGVRLSIL